MMKYGITISALHTQTTQMEGKYKRPFLLEEIFAVNPICSESCGSIVMSVQVDAHSFLPMTFCQFIDMFYMRCALQRIHLTNGDHHDTCLN